MALYVIQIEFIAKRFQKHCYLFIRSITLRERMIQV